MKKIQFTPKLTYNVMIIQCFVLYLWKDLFSSLAMEHIFSIITKGQDELRFYGQATILNL